MSPIPYRLRLGISGSRNLNGNDEKISIRLKKIIEEHLIDFFETETRKSFSKLKLTPFALSIISPLAEGADRLAVREVLNVKTISGANEKYSIVNSCLDAVLPLTTEDYLQDFKTEESKKEFSDLLSLSRKPVFLRDKSLTKEYDAEALSDARRNAYYNVGMYVVDNCDILIAIWDGKEGTKRGGTADIVAYARRKNKPLIILNKEFPDEYKLENKNKLSNKDIESLEDFNKQLLKESKTDNKENYLNKFFKDSAESIKNEIPSDKLELLKHKLLPYYFTATTLADKKKKYYETAGISVYILAALSIILAAFNGHIFELMTLSGIIVIVLFTNSQNTRKKWIENRFLAERIRSGIFLTVCNVEMQKINIPKFMLIAHKPDDWMIRTFNEIWNTLPKMSGVSKQSFNSCKNFVLKYWVNEQKEWQGKKAEKFRKQHKIFEIIEMVIFIFAVVLVLAHILLGKHSNSNDKFSVLGLLGLLGIILPALGSALKGISSYRELVRIEKRSENMEGNLLELKSRFETINENEYEAIKKFENLLHETSELMLRETQDWLMVMSFVNLKLEA